MVSKQAQVAKPLVSELTERKHRNLIPFKPGQSGNPRGRPRGARNRLGEEFLAELYGQQSLSWATLCHAGEPSKATISSCVVLSGRR